MKNYSQWLNELAVSMASPASMEMSMGNINTRVDPKSDEWAKELVRLKEYIGFAERIQKALDDGDDSELRIIIDQIKEMPLFRSEQDGGWKRVQITGAENTGNTVENRKQVARYIINKIAEFKDWHEKT
jgi:hypothetical protein